MKQLPFDAILNARLSRRSVVTAAATSVGLAACARIPTTVNEVGRPSPFTSLAPRNDDAFVVATGYRYNVVTRWGDSLVAGTPSFDTGLMRAGSEMPTRFSANDTSFSAGLGIGVPINDHFELGLDLSQYRQLAPDFTFEEEIGQVYETDATVLSLGARFRF